MSTDPLRAQDPADMGLLRAGDPPQLRSLTVSVAPQGSQQELGFRAGAVGVSNHNLGDGQVVHEGEQTLVCPPANGTCIGGAVRGFCPFASLHLW